MKNTEEIIKKIEELLDEYTNLRYDFDELDIFEVHARKNEIETVFDELGVEYQYWEL